jgi:HEXXH motif-containing protein
MKSDNDPGNLDMHVVTDQMLQVIGRGGGSPDPIPMLIAGQRSKQRLLLRAVIDSAAAVDHIEMQMATDGYRLLTQLEHSAADAVERVLRYPAVGAWALHTVLGLQSKAPAAVSPGRLATVAAAAAMHASLPCEIELPPPVAGAIEFPSLGRLYLPENFPAGPLWLRSDGKTVKLLGPGGCLALPSRSESEASNWQSIPIITAGQGSLQIALAFDFVDPCRFPGHRGVLESLPKSELDRWLRRLTRACNLLIRYHHETAREVAALIVAVTPLARPSQGQVSASSRRAFGSIALSLPADDVSLALALAHEVQHAKLSALMDLVPLVSATGRDRFYAPWREDARPLAGLLQGVYAHIGIAEFWRRHRLLLREPAEMHRAYTEFARWRDATASCVRFLNERPELTKGGRLFAAAMAERLSTLLSDFVPVAAQEDADRAAKEHRERWLHRHGRTAQ